MAQPTSITMDDVFAAIGKKTEEPPTPRKKLWSPPQAATKSACEYCRGSGFEIVSEAYPEMYHNDAKVDFAVPCRICKGQRRNFVQETRASLVLPYYYGLSAFNPCIYKDENGNIIDFKKQYEFIRNYCENYKEVASEVDIKGLYIHSATAGNGKTFLASCICYEMYNRHHLMPTYITENNLLDRLTANVSYSQISPRAQLQEAPILFIDDMWRKETGREWVNDEIFNIIDYRYTHSLPTIITSNVPLTSDKIDKRIGSRLNAMCAPIKIPDVEIRNAEQQERRRRMFEAFNGKKDEE